MSFSGGRLREGARLSCHRFARLLALTARVGFVHQEYLRADPLAPRRSPCERREAIRFEPLGVPALGEEPRSAASQPWLSFPAAVGREESHGTRLFPHPGLRTSFLKSEGTEPA